MANNYYERTFAFASRTTARGSEVKAEFDGIVAGMAAIESDTNRSIKMPAGTSVDLPVIAADRALTVIGFDSNGDVEVQAGIGAFQGDWATGTDYLVRDIMLDAGGELGLNNVYICNVAHTSSASLATDSANWDLMIDVTDVKASEVAAAASAAAALVSEGLADADATQTAADRVQTGLDVLATAANLAATNQDAIDTAANLAATNQDAIDTAADVVTTNANVALTGADVTSAENAKVAAEAAQTAAELALDSFDDRYLGAKASEPTLDNDSNALLDGALFWDTTVNALKVYDLGGTSWALISNPTKASIDALGVDADTLDGQHASAFEPADGTILKDADIGSTIQAYDATILKSANIGSTVQGYDVNTAKVDVADDWTATQSYNPVTLTDAATINWNMAASPSAIVSLSANRTMGNPTNIKAGNWYTLRIFHSGAPRTLAWGSYWKFGGNGAPELSTLANDYDVLTFYAHGTAALSFVGIAKNIAAV
jgi:hypothetical protein